MNFIKVSVFKIDPTISKDGQSHTIKYETVDKLINSNHIISITPVVFQTPNGDINGYCVRTRDKRYKVSSLPEQFKKLFE